MLPPHDVVLSLLGYSQETGEFTWKARPGSARFNAQHAGKRAGHVAKDDGYVVIGLGGKLHKAHRLAWLIATGEAPAVDVDHIDGNRANNAIANLRLATRSQNLANSFRPEKSTSGFKGVSWRNRSKPWVAHIKHQGKSIFIGSFASAEEAHAAYVQKAASLFGPFHRAA